MENYIKYPRTPHLPWSRGASEDDIFISEKRAYHFASMSEIIVTEKLDGENTTLYRDYLHARAIVGIDHPSRSWIKNLHGQIKNDIPVGWRICGENLYAKHSIHYTDLESYFFVFAIFDDQNNCLSWNDTMAYADILGLAVVPTLYRGKWNFSIFKEFDERIKSSDKFEGYVIRNSDSFHYSQFTDHVAKCVRPNHVRTTDHWRNQEMIVNQLRDDS